MLVGGSLFFALLLVPQLVGLVDSGGNIGASADQREITSEEIDLLREIAVSPEFSDEEKDKRMADVLSGPPDDDPKLTRLLKQADDAINRFHLPCSIDGTTIRIEWPVKKSFDTRKFET